MKTAVQTLIENLYNHEHHIDILDVAQLNGYFEQALKAEKEQIEALEKHIKELKLYAFQPQGHGEQSFFTIAKSEEEAIKAVNKHIEKVYPKGSPNEYDAAGWGTDYYKMTVIEEGQVVENNNQ